MSESSTDWIFEIDEDVVINIRHHLPPGWNDGYAFGRNRPEKPDLRLLELHPNGDLRVLAGYAWDGCTPKLIVLDLSFGIPDGIPNDYTRKPKAYYASLVHDALYQFLDDGLPISRKCADRIFLELLERDCFLWRKLYYIAVRLLGGAFHRFTRWKRDYTDPDYKAFKIPI